MFTPTIVKLLKYLKDSQVKKTSEELALIIDEPQEYVNKALERTIAIGAITREGEGYLYVSTPSNDSLTTQLSEVYEAVSRQPARELLLRGLICQIPAQYLFQINTLLEILEKEGFDKREFCKFLGQELPHGYLKKMRLIYLGMKPAFVPICIPPYYFYYLRNLGMVDGQTDTGHEPDYQNYEFQEEDYIIAQYPSELTNPAREYAVGENRDLKASLRKRGLVNWGGGLWKYR